MFRCLPKRRADQRSGISVAKCSSVSSTRRQRRLRARWSRADHGGGGGEGDAQGLRVAAAVQDDEQPLGGRAPEEGQCLRLIECAGEREIAAAVMTQFVKDESPV